MSLTKIFDIASSGMSVQDIRLSTVASNLANADSTSSSSETTYKARQPVFAATMADYAQNTYPSTPEAVGTRVLGIVESDVPLKMEYQPDHPQANENGMIFKTNVNVMHEMANLLSASRSYQVNVEMSKTAQELLMRTLNLGQS